MFVQRLSALSIVAVTIPIALHAQFTLEHSYTNAAIGFQHYNKLYSVQLEALGDVYVLVDKTDRFVQLMDMAHIVIGTIDLTDAPDIATGPAGRDVLYVSQHLFDLDEGVELMYVTQTVSFDQPSPVYSCVTTIVDEDGSVLQSWPNEGPWVTPNTPQSQEPIYNTSNGTKLILSDWTTWNANVYSLPGSLHLGVMGTTSADMVSASVTVHPNPTDNTITIDLGWQSASERTVIQITSADGAIVLDRTLHSSREEVSLGSLAAGLYLYRVLVDGREVSNGKITKL